MGRLEETGGSGPRLITVAFEMQCAEYSDLGIGLLAFTSYLK
jgi:hypothetical protein